MKKLNLVVFNLMIFCVSASFAQDYAKNAARIISGVIGADIKGYQIYSYPTNNFGVGTTCVKKWVPKGQMVLDMINSYGLENIPENSPLWRSLNSFAFRATGSSIQVSDTLNRIYGLNVLLPKILNLLNINADASINGSRSFKLTIDSAMIRYLDYDKFVEFIKSKSEKSLLFKAYDAGKLVVATSDLILLGYKLEVGHIDSAGIALSTKLSNIDTTKVNSANSSLSFKISKNELGNYLISSSKPVVLGVYIQKQNKLTLNSGQKGFGIWDNVTDNNEVADPTIANPN